MNTILSLLMQAPPLEDPRYDFWATFGWLLLLPLVLVGALIATAYEKWRNRTYRRHRREAERLGYEGYNGFVQYMKDSGNWGKG